MPLTACGRNVAATVAIDESADKNQGSHDMMLDDAIRNAQSDRQVCALLTAYMESLDPDLVNREPNPEDGDINSVRARFRTLIHELDKGSTCDSDKRPVINQALYIYGEALSRLQMLSTARQEQTSADSKPYATGFMPRAESALLAA